MLSSSVTAAKRGASQMQTGCWERQGMVDLPSQFRYAFLRGAGEAAAKCGLRRRWSALRAAMASPTTTGSADDETCNHRSFVHSRTPG